MPASDHRRGIDDGPNSRPLNDTVAQTGPGIPDDAASPGYDPVADTQAEHDAEMGEATPRGRSGQGPADPFKPPRPST